MELQLSWDIVFVALILVMFGVAFFRPHKFTLRLLLGTYLSLIVTEGVTLFLGKIIIPAAPELQSWVSEREIIFFMSIRLLLFLTAMLLFLLRGHYRIEHKKHDHWFARSMIHMLFAALVSLLISTSIFSFLSGNSVIEAALGGFPPNAWFDGSILIEPLLQGYGAWLALPAVGMLIVSIIGPRD